MVVARGHQNDAELSNRVNALGISQWMSDMINMERSMELGSLDIHGLVSGLVDFKRA
jgi:hypothetical protein